MNTNLSPPPEREFPAARLQQRKEQLMSLIEAEKPHQPRRPLRSAYDHRRLIAAIAVAVAAAVAIAAPVLVFTGGGSGPRSAGQYIQSPPRVSLSGQRGPQFAAAVLLRAAHTAANQPAAKGPGPGQFFYTKSEGLSETQQGRPTGIWPTFFVPFARETWVSPNGSGRTYEADKHVLFPTAADAAVWNRVYKNQPNALNAHTSNTTLKPGDFPYVDLSKVPTDPAQLKELIEGRTLEPSPPGDAQTFQIIGDLLRYYYAPPAVRSALYTIASQLPGVQLIGSTHDQLGRPGIGVAYYLPGPPHGPVDKDAVYELIFDPQTSTLLAEQTVVVHRSDSTPFPPGTVTGWTAYLASGIVNSTTATTSATP